MKNDKNLLTGGWGKTRTASFDLKHSVIETYLHSLSEARKLLAQWQRDTRNETRSELVNFKSTVEEVGSRIKWLQESGAEDWDATLLSFNASWRRLRNAVKKAKKDFKKHPVHPSRHWSF